ncbi:MAG: pentapeptide repeat-containing protein, partial [Actinomycetes bacterium]
MFEQVETRGEDWYGRDFGNDRYVDCSFVDVDLTESRSRGAVFEDCRFDNCKLNVSAHEATAFVGCDFRRSSLFGASFVGCKLTGSLFVECKLRPITVEGGQWSGVVLRGADLSGQELVGLT